MRKRNNVVPIRFSDHELSVIDANAKRAKMSRTEYLVSAGMDKPIVILDNLKPMLTELCRIGNNINQLTRKANSGEIYVVGLNEINEQLGAVAAGLVAIQKEVSDLSQR
ncbi:MAG: MobC family plasmid mobilization relaxosome protein [Clostridiales bacterium]|nr:MobC family plasmid mobilization relaxosome protein [Clostridiales bacterium]